MALAVTTTPSARSASAWFRAPSGCDLGCVTDDVHGEGARDTGGKGVSYLGEMMPLALMTLCQGTFSLW